MTTVYINGRFLSQRTTGVQRYALEVLLALDALLAAESRAEHTWTLLVPRGVSAPKLDAVAVREVGFLRGHAWEQLELPLAARDGLLWSFGPTGPLWVRNQVVTMHDAAVYRVAESFGRAFRAWYRSSMPLLARRIAHTMTVSEFSRAELHAAIGLSPTSCTVSGEGHEHALRVPADGAILQRHALEPGRYVLAVSSIAPHKNFGLLVDALRFLGEVDFQIVIAGSANARIFGELGANLERIKLLGYVSDAELRALYENAGLFVFPSRYEGFGLPPLEAMVHTCPVLAARAGALPEVCGEGARYFSPDDPRELASLITELMSSPRERAALAARGSRELDRHRWSNAAGAHLAVARRLLSALR